MPERGIVISLFDYTGHMVEPWAEAGYLCYCVDRQHPPGETRSGNVVRVGADVRDWLPPFAQVAILFAFPPCTHVAVSGARWFRDKGLGRLIESLACFEAAVRLAEWTRAPYLIENPVSTVSTYWRPPDHTFDPCDYGGYLEPPGDAYTKKTCLWTGNGFRLPEPRRVPPTEGSRILRYPPSDERANLRSATPRGFARAVFLAHHATPHEQGSVKGADLNGCSRRQADALTGGPRTSQCTGGPHHGHPETSRQALKPRLH